MSFLFKKWYYLAAFFVLMWGVTMGVALVTGPMKTSDWVFEGVYAAFLIVMFTVYWTRIRKGNVRLGELDAVMTYDYDTRELTLVAIIPDHLREQVTTELFKSGARYRIDGKTIGADENA